MRLEPHEIDEIARAFVTARRRARPLDGFPGRLPETLADSAAVQELALQISGETVAGWKVAMVPPPLRAPLAAERITGPVDATSVVRVDDGGSVEVSVFDGGFAAVEAEFVVVLGEDLRPGPDGYTVETVAPAVAAIRAGVEIASSPLAGLNAIGPLAVVCDHGNNAGVVVGPPIAGWRDLSMRTMTSRTSVDGIFVGEGSAATVPGGPLAAVAWLAGHLAGRGRRLCAGDIVSTGMTTGVHPVRPGSIARFEFAFVGGFDVRVVARPPAGEAIETLRTS